jgi:hypothetical protein
LDRYHIDERATLSLLCLLSPLSASGAALQASSVAAGAIAHVEMQHVEELGAGRAVLAVVGLPCHLTLPLSQARI